MRTLTLPLPMLILLYGSAAFAQTPQTTVDIGVTVPKYSSGVVETRVTRKDPLDKSALVPAMPVRVTIAVKGEKPFFTTQLAMKPGGADIVTAKYPGDASSKIFVVTAVPLAHKEIASGDNTRETPPTLVGPMTLPGRLPLPNRSPPPSPRDPASGVRPAPAPAPPPPAPAPAPAPPAPAPAPAAAPEIPADAIRTAGLVVVGGVQRSPATLGGDFRVTAPQLVIVGGAQRSPTTLGGDFRITTPPLVLIGRRE